MVAQNLIPRHATVQTRPGNLCASQISYKRAMRGSNNPNFSHAAVAARQGRRQRQRTAQVSALSRRTRFEKWIKDSAFMGLVTIGAAAVFAFVWSMPMPVGPQPASSDAAPMYSKGRPGEPITGCKVTDGDTIRCGSERIRLLGIDAPELPGHCREGRTCAPGNPLASTESLRVALTGNLTIKRISTDRYGRTIALVSGSMGDLSCWQLRRGQAIYRGDWDNGAKVKSICADKAKRTVG